MKVNYNQVADEIINQAKQVLAAGQRTAPEIDTTGMSQIGKHVFGKVSEFSFSPAVAAKSILREGYSQFTAIVSKLTFGSADFTAANAAQDKISDEAEKMGFEL